MNFDKFNKKLYISMGIGKIIKNEGSTGVKKLISCFKIIYYLSLS